MFPGIGSSFWDTTTTASQSPPVFETREERIAAFNKIAANVDEMEGETKTKHTVSTTLNYQGKAISRGEDRSLDRMKPIAIKELRIGVTHRKRVLHARIVSRVMRMTSVMVLVEDHLERDIADLAVYGLPDPKAMRESRYIAIIEPHYKIRQDGSPGIRIDNPDDIVWDVTFESVCDQGESVGEGPTVGEQDEVVTLEKRLQQIFTSDPKLGVDKAFHKVRSEGHDATKKQVRALKKAILDYQQNGEAKPQSQSLPAVLSERRPENHRVFKTPAILDLRTAGKREFEQGQYKAAEKSFSDAIALTKTEKSEPLWKLDEICDSVALWQLIGNRSSTRYKLGMLDEALQDALLSHRCAPNEAFKPVLRCIETMAVLGMKTESKLLLEEAGAAFPGHQGDIARKQSQLEAKQVLQVGPNKQYRSISEAVRDARDGAEILVDPGRYSEPPILFNKLVMLRSSKTISAAGTLSEETSTLSNSRPEIRVVGDFCAATCNTSSSNIPVCIDGFKIVCQGNPRNSYYAVNVLSGLVVIRNTVLTSTSGPVVNVQDIPLQPLSLFVQPVRSGRPSRLVMHSCKVMDGAQGGILVADKTNLSLRQVHVVGNAACGVELRNGGSAQVENCCFYGNGRQGIVVWMSAGRLDAKTCWIHSHAEESGALISEGTTDFKSCEFYGNGAAGVVAQGRGLLYMKKCLIHDKNDGILIQETGSALVDRCKIFRNRANGIFVGYDHRGSANITGNIIYDNVSRGILIGNKGKIVKVSKNTERNNKGMPPQTPSFMHKRFAPTKKHYKHVQKNKGTIEQAMKEQSPTGGILDSLLQGHHSEKILFQVTESMAKQCLFCGKEPPEDAAEARFPRCSRCREAPYCSAECQHKDWPRHKVSCRPKNVKYPAFIDGNKSVADIYSGEVSK